MARHVQSVDGVRVVAVVFCVPRDRGSENVGRAIAQPAIDLVKPDCRAALGGQEELGEDEIARGGGWHRGMVAGHGLFRHWRRSAETTTCDQSKTEPRLRTYLQAGSGIFRLNSHNRAILDSHDTLEKCGSRSFETPRTNAKCIIFFRGELIGP